MKAIVVRKPGAPARSRHHRLGDAAHCKFQDVKSVDFINSIPHNLSGKILKCELRELYWKRRDRGVN